LADGLRSGWLVLLPLLLLPVANSIPVLRQMHANLAVLAVMLLTWAWAIRSPSSTPQGIALLGTSGNGRRIGAWELCLLAFVAAVAIAYLVVGTRVRGFVYADAAYYYGVARHMALTRRFEEPIVWHFLHLPETLVHAPFDYWGSMTSLLLVPPLLLFGASATTAILTMAFLSAAVLVGFWYLICFALPLRHCTTQLLALVLFAFSPALDLYRFQPESITVAHLFLLGSLIAFCLRRAVLAILCGFGLLLTRGDGSILFLLILFAVVLAEWRRPDGGPGHPWRLVLVGLGCVSIYMLWSLASFGTLSPPATQIVPFLPSYWQVYDLGVPHHFSWHTFLDHFSGHALVGRMRYAATSMWALPITPMFGWWLALAALPVVWLVRRPASPQSLIWVLCFAGYTLVACLAGSGFASARTPYTFVPLIILAGAFAVDAGLTLLAVRVLRGDATRATAAAIGALVLAVCAVLLGRLPTLQAIPVLPDDLPPGVTVPAPEELSKLDRVLGGEPVMTNLPWQIISYTQSPAVSLPWDGEAAIESVLARYDVRWMVLFGAVRDCTIDKNPSCPVFMRVLSSDTTDVGRFRLERVGVEEASLPAVFRVSTTP